jgi:hypothetical protein
MRMQVGQKSKAKKEKSKKRKKEVKSGFLGGMRILSGSQLKTFWDLRYAVRGFVALRKVGRFWGQFF